MTGVKLRMAIRRGAHRLVAALAVVLCALAPGCASGASSSRGFTPQFGQSAVVAARHVPGCSRIRLSEPPRLYGGGTTTSTGVVGSAATCLIDGEPVKIVVWRDAAGAHAPFTTIQSGSAAMAKGTSWRATVNDFNAPFARQRKIAEGIAKALNGEAITLPSR